MYLFRPYKMYVLHAYMRIFVMTIVNYWKLLKSNWLNMATFCFFHYSHIQYRI